MEKNTLLAIVLSIAVLIGFYVVQGIFFAPAPVTQVTQPMQQQEQPQDAYSQTAPLQTAEQPPPAQGQQAPVYAGTAFQFEPVPDDDLVVEEFHAIENNLVTVVFSSKGGDVVSWKLKGHKDKGGEDVEMVLPGLGANQSHAFTVILGTEKNPRTDLFRINKPYADADNLWIEFSKDYAISVPENAVDAEPQIFTLKKRFEFRPNDYMCMLKITLEGKNSSAVNLNFGGYMLSFGPQMGPWFEKLDGRIDYRQYITFLNDTVNEVKIDSNTNSSGLINSNPKWAAIAGKYFTFIAYPSNRYDLVFSQFENSNSDIKVISQMDIIRPGWDNTGKVDDTYFFYLGPKSQDVLNAYDIAQNNGFGHSGMKFSEIAASRGFLSPVETVLKWLLVMLYNVVRNYGVAIILLTLLVKILFFPLTKKSSMATLRMQAVAPKIKELQEKYKDNRQKLNMEMAELYKKEGYNPLSGCLPMLLQIPIFFAMYNLFSTHFDLRSAMFIPGWIPDLSQAEYVWEFTTPLPIVGWTALRLLPFIYVASQLIYGKVTQVPNQKSTGQMKFMMYIMPIIFFFILYNVPSGLLVYWIFSNILTLVQQVIINKYFLPKQAANTVNVPVGNVIAPNKKKKNKW
ncbi:MAG: membrane protein insertase YidC [Treponema sp.]|nr:membrane protein insertase YidC [Treponema sp.]